MSYLSNLKSIVGADRAVQPAASVIGSATTLIGADESAIAKFVKGIKKTELTDVSTGSAMLLAGAAAGAVLGVRQHHPVIGAIAGASVGRNAPALMRPDERKYAMANLGQTGCGVLGSLVFKNAPVVGFVIGWLAGGFAVGGLRK